MNSLQTQITEFQTALNYLYSINSSTSHFALGDFLSELTTQIVSGGVTSVALSDGSATPIYSISGSPVTSTGTLTFTLETQSANTVFAGPRSGSATQPSFRSLVSADIPILPYLSTTLGTPNGLSVSGNTLSLGVSSNSTSGALSSTDWNTFNNKMANLAINYTQVVYISMGGNDTTGDGSIGNPFATIDKAMNSITDASQSKPYLIQIGPGTFSLENSTQIQPFVIIQGCASNISSFSESTYPQITTITSTTGTLSFTTEWTTQAGPIPFGGIRNIWFNNSGSGNWTITFPTPLVASASFDFINCTFSSESNFSITSASNIVIYNCTAIGTNFTFDIRALLINNSQLQSVTFNDDPNYYTSTIIFNSALYSHFNVISLYSGTYVEVFDSVTNGVTLSGINTFLIGDSVSLSNLNYFAFLNGASAYNNVDQTTESSSIFYTPDNAAVWPANLYLLSEALNSIGDGTFTPPNLNITSPQTTYNGSVSGTAIWSMPFQGTTYKKFMINLQNLNDAGGTITFPTAFTVQPYLYGDTAAVAISTSNTTTFTLNSSAGITGNVFVEGY